MADLNEKYSYKFHTNKSFTDVDSKDFDNTEIKGAAFGQKEPFTKVFPDGMTGAIFTDCNLNNCIVPKECEVNGGSHKQIKEQADGEMWVVDANLDPVAPLKPYRFDRAGLSKDPAMIATQAATRVAVSDKPGASTKKLPVTAVKDHLVNVELGKLVADRDKLLQILTTEGKI